MAAKPFTAEAIVLAEKKMCSMTLDDLIKMSKKSRMKKQRAPIKSQRRSYNNAAAAQEKLRSCIRQGLLDQRRFQGQQVPKAAPFHRVSVFDRISSGVNSSNIPKPKPLGSVFDRISSGDNSNRDMLGYKTSAGPPNIGFSVCKRQGPDDEDSQQFCMVW